MFDAQLKKVCAFYNAVFLRLQTEIKAVTGMCAHNTTSLPRTWLLVWHHIAADARPRGCGRLAASERSVDYIASSLCTMDGMTALETLLHHLSCELSKLVDFAEVNVEGFRKIAKKFHKHVPESGMRFMPRVRAQPMAHQHDVQSIANLLESGLGELSRVKRTVEVCGAVAVPVCAWACADGVCMCGPAGCRSTVRRLGIDAAHSQASLASRSSHRQHETPRVRAQRAHQ